MQFSHLHVHTQYSLLDGAANISSLYSKARKYNNPALAITDHGNMFGVFKFVAEAWDKKNLNEDGTLKVKPIVGCEFYVVENREKRSFTREEKDVRYHQLLLAKNSEGYKNLVKLCSLGYMEGLYGKYPRIDKSLIEKYAKGLIATTCCLGATVPRMIVKYGEEQALNEFKWWHNLFGEDYYIEIQRHGIPEQNIVNEVLLKWAKQFNVKVICSNDSHYVEREDSNAHDILLCINTGEKQSTPKWKGDGEEDQFVKGSRFAFFNDEFYFKTPQEMEQLFADIPESLDNTNEIVDKIEPLNLKQDILLPNYEIPNSFSNQDDYLKHLTYDGALKRYGELEDSIKERIDFELFTIRTMGFAGYFLIVQDFINHGKDIGVFVGPGRGSAAGSAVAYCIGITNIDPIKYNLLFERFLNPDRKSMPDIDTDFDDEGRQKVIDYVVEKYGKNQVAQIVTYGTMAAKMSIKDVARVLDLPLADSNFLAKLVPEKPGITLNRIIKAPLTKKDAEKLVNGKTDEKGEKSLEEKEALATDDLDQVKQLREIYNGNDLRATVIKEALVLEGSVRGTGLHAAGIIIAPKDLSEILPVATSKETNLLITQFEGKVIEDAGVIKMDFLGLKTLTIIRDALKLIKLNHGVEIDIQEIPLDDKKTFELYQKGLTNGTFQFESPGMQKHLLALKPDKFEDLIAMNALYRPGPLAYIPQFIKRKLGQEQVSYDLPELEEYLAETYGITVYQEQVMLLSQKLASFTKGDADVLRKAMGKKDKATLDKMKNKFIEGCEKNKLEIKVCEKIWTDWEAFAQYAFNKSHSTCYAFVAFQTAYLKAHYPAEYMASVLNHAGAIEKITFFMEECRSIGIPVLGPHVNESFSKFAVVKNSNTIRFGLSALKGVGEVAIDAIIEERLANGQYTSVFNLAQRVNLRAVTKKSFEGLAFGGGFDCFENVHRAQYFNIDNNEKQTMIDKIVRFGNLMQENANSSQIDMFGQANDDGNSIPEPVMPACEAWSTLEKLRFEKEVVGMYLSGHPLDTYDLELNKFCNVSINELKEPNKLENRDLSFAGIITLANHRTTKQGKPFGTFNIEDFDASIQLNLFSEDYLRFKHFLVPDTFLHIKAKAQKRWNNEELEIKISSIQLLDELRDKLSKKITIQLSIHEFDDIAVENFKAIFAKYPGSCIIEFEVYDEKAMNYIELPSKKWKVNPSNELINELKQLGNFTIELNKNKDEIFLNKLHIKSQTKTVVVQEEVLNEEMEIE